MYEWNLVNCKTNPRNNGKESSRVTKNTQRVTNGEFMFFFSQKYDMNAFRRSLVRPVGKTIFIYS